MSTNGDHSITRASTRTRSSSRVTRYVYACCQRSDQAFIVSRAEFLSDLAVAWVQETWLWCRSVSSFSWSSTLIAFSRPCRGGEGLGTRPDAFLDCDASCVLVTWRPVLTSYGWTLQVQRIRRQSRAGRDPRASCPTRTPGAYPWPATSFPSLASPDHWPRVGRSRDRRTARVRRDAVLRRRRHRLGVRCPDLRCARACRGADRVRADLASSCL